MRELMISTHFGRRLRAARPGLLALVVIATSAHANLVDIAWSEQGRFEHNASVAPGKFVELCGKLAKGQVIAWSFKGEQPLDFNIHYHQGKQVVFPAKRSGVAALDGQLAVALDQDYCWMWTNKTAAPAALAVRLQR